METRSSDAGWPGAGLDLLGPPRAIGLRTNLLVDPLAIAGPAPCLSWRVTGTRRQFGYAVRVLAGVNPEPVWETKRVASWHQRVTYDGPALVSGQTYSWQVQIWGDGDHSGPWSLPATFETGMSQADSVGEWVSAPSGSAYETLYLRGDLELDRPPVRARAYASAAGWYHLLVNGEDLTGPALVPRWTSYGNEVEYQAYDVTHALVHGANSVAMAVGDGRYRGCLGVSRRRRVFGADLAACVHVVVELDDGRIVRWGTSPSWRSGAGRIQRSDPVLGEQVDLRIDDAAWLGASAASWPSAPVRVVPAPARRLIPEDVPPVTQINRHRPAQLCRTPSGRVLVDAGANVVGHLRTQLWGDSGSRVRLTYSEVLTPEGELDTSYLDVPMAPRGEVIQRDEALVAEKPTWFEPWFTLHGFRYVEVDGAPEGLCEDDVEVVVISSDLPSAGEFVCSSDDISTLHDNIVRSTRGNFTDTATGCPTRERSGWTGDLQVFAPTTTGIVDCQAYLRRYLRTLALDQEPDGRVPRSIPRELGPGSRAHERRIESILAGSAGWGDVAVRLPMTLHRYYGDDDVVATQFDSMCAWVDFLRTLASRPAVPGSPGWLARRRAGDVGRCIVATGFHWGEWLRPAEMFPANLLDGTVHGSTVATAYLASSAALVADAARLLDKATEAQEYDQLAERTREAWRRAFVRGSGGSGRIGRDRQDDYVRALAFSLVSEADAPWVARRLVQLIRDKDDHLDTGFLSTPLLLPVLADAGYPEVAYDLLGQTTAPSWLAQVRRGATTTWETWEGHGPDGRARASHNHYAFGSVGLFLREYVLGIRPGEPGYRRVVVRPMPGGGLTWAEGSVQTPHGTVWVRWEVAASSGHLKVVIPPGTTGHIVCPGGQPAEVEPGRHEFTW